MLQWVPKRRSGRVSEGGSEGLGKGVPDWQPKVVLHRGKRVPQPEAQPEGLHEGCPRGCLKGTQGVADGTEGVPDRVLRGCLTGYQWGV